MSFRDFVVAVFGGSLILALDRAIDGRPMWALGYLAAAFVMYIGMPKPAQ